LIGRSPFVFNSPLPFPDSGMLLRGSVNLRDTKPTASTHERLIRAVCVINTYSDCNVSRKFIWSQSHTNMKYLIPLLAFLLIGCDGEKSNEPTNPNLEYKIEGDTVTITHCVYGASGELIIPSVIEGNPVTSIGYNAFSKRYSLKSITIPDCVTNIGEKAFYNCTSLTSITIGNGVTSIGDWAFAYCTSLTRIKIPDSVTSIGEDAFSGTSLTRITIPDGVTSIGWGAFSDCTNLTRITIPDGVTSIGQSAFWSCPSLKSITIGNGVTSIGDGAFSNCTSLTSVTFLGNAPKISNDAFEQSSPTIYRKADAKGWGDTFAGRPVKLITEKP